MKIPVQDTCSQLITKCRPDGVGVDVVGSAVDGAEVCGTTRMKYRVFV